MNKRTVMRVWLIAAGLIMLTPASSRSADLAAGELLANKWCAECHAVRADRRGPNPSAPTFPELAAEPSITKYSLRALLRTPHETMPQITFTPDQIEDIVNYILSMKPRR